MEEEIKDEKKDFIQPSAIIEILSPATRNYDQGDKFKLYRDIPALKDILIDSSSVTVYIHTKNESGFWVFKEFSRLEDILNIECINFRIRLGDIYKGTGLKEKESL